MSENNEMARPAEPRGDFFEAQPNLRQQDKIVAVMESGDYQLLGQDQVAEAGGDRDEFLLKLALGEVSREDFSRQVLDHVAVSSPPQSARELCQALNQDKRQAALTVGILRGEQHLGENLRASDTALFLGEKKARWPRSTRRENFQDPWRFYDAAVEQLAGLEESKGPAVASEYAESYREIVATVYGKKGEYLQQMLLMMKEAHERFPQAAAAKEEIEAVRAEKDVNELKARLANQVRAGLETLQSLGKIGPETRHDHRYHRLKADNPLFSLIPQRIFQLTGNYDPALLSRLEDDVLAEKMQEVMTDPLGRTTRLEAERQKLENFSLKKISPEESRAVMEKVELRGDPYKGKSLTPEILEKSGLLPAYQLELGPGVTCFLSPPYELDSDREAFVAYVKNGDRITACSYYRSASTGGWRYLPNYYKDAWYGKDLGLGSISLPIMTQKALALLSGGDKARRVSDPQLIFHGPAHSLSAQEYSAYQDYYCSRDTTGREEATRYLEKLKPPAAPVEAERLPRKLAGNFYPSTAEGKIPPQQVDFDHVGDNPEAPDFSMLITSWVDRRPSFGQYLEEVYPSRDGRLRYPVCQDAAGRFWYLDPEVADSPLLPNGLRREWVQGGELTTPAVTHGNAGGGYGEGIENNSEYVDMYARYLKHLPPIQRYLQHLKLRG